MLDGNGNELGVTGPGGTTLYAKGQSTILIVVLAAALGILVWDMHRVAENNSQALTQIRDEHRAILEETKIQSYLLSRPEGQRPRLRVPASLDKRVEVDPQHPSETWPKD